MFSKINQCSVFDFYESDKDYISFPFYFNGKPLDSVDSPRCCLTLHKAGSMRFRWNEKNENRNSFFSGFNKQVVPLELIHSKIVYDVDSNPEKLLQKNGDGLITINQNIIPVVTVADCVPLYLFNPETKCFGVVHSGWKGTGIIYEAIDSAIKQYGGKISDFCVVIGPHIHNCCYSIDSDRVEFFTENFGKECISFDSDDNAYLSLATANIQLLLKAGVLPQNILHCNDCTCCDSRLGSFRRETKNLPAEIDLQERLKLFTPMAAFVCF